jgi:hypothetical protein
MQQAGENYDPAALRVGWKRLEFCGLRNLIRRIAPID